MYIKRTFFFFALIFCWVSSSAQSYDLGDLEGYLDKQLNSKSLKSASIGVAVYNLSKDEYVYTHNPDLSLVPASTMKTLTTATALELFGGSYRFRTFLEYDGYIDKQGTLHGNLYVRGGGDPTLGSGRFEGYPSYDTVFMKWTEDVLAQGIKKIEGKIIGDASYFEYNHVPDGWQWNDLGNYYGASAQGLNINDNVYYMVFKPNFQGRRAKLARTEPKMEGMEIVNNVTTAGYGTGDNSYIYGSPFTKLRFIQGTIPASREEFKVKGAMPDPAGFIADYLKQKLKDTGVAVSGAATTLFALEKEGNKPTKARKVISVMESPRLADIVKMINEWSVNLYAEALLKHIGVKLAKTSLPEPAAEAVENYWKKRGIDVNGMFLQDGSGLSHTNALTPRQFIALLRYCKAQPYASVFEESLAIAGEEGTLRRLCRGTPAAGNLKGKSGSLYRVACYVGYVTTPDGDELTFSLMANKYNTYYSAMQNRWEKVMIMLSNMDL